MSTGPTTDETRRFAAAGADEGRDLQTAADRFGEFVRTVEPAIRDLAEKAARERGSVYEGDSDLPLVCREDVVRAGWALAMRMSPENPIAPLGDAVIRRAEDMAGDYDEAEHYDRITGGAESFDEILDAIANPRPPHPRLKAAMQKARGLDDTLR